MRLTPKTEREILEENLWPAGVYGFEVAFAEEKVSQSGNDMIRLTLNVFNQNGNSRTVYDYLVENTPAKLRHAAVVCGLLGKYNSGHLDARDFEGKTGQLKLYIKKDKSGQYADQNAVADYLTTEEAVQSAPSMPPRQAAVVPELNDEIPF